MRGLLNKLGIPAAKAAIRMDMHPQTLRKYMLENRIPEDLVEPLRKLIAARIVELQYALLDLQ